MTLLEIFFVVSGVIILIFSFDIAKRQKFNALHFLVFFVIWITLLLFSFFPEVLNYVWSVFWLQRWADLLVYVSIIFLIYFSLLLLNKIESTSRDLTLFIRNLAIESSKKQNISWKYLFIIPAYNEGEVIYQTVKNVLDNWYENILVVNDWSNDNTISELSKLWDKITIISHLKNRWQWAALETWFEYVRRFCDVEYIITYDSDWQHCIEDVKTFDEAIKNNPEIKVFLWSRFKWKTKNMSIFKRIILKLAIIFTFIISSIKLSDTHNWFRALKKDSLNDIKITIDGMWHASEILDIISAKNIAYIEVPVSIIYTDYSIAKWQKASNAINIALKMIWMKFFR